MSPVVVPHHEENPIPENPAVMVIARSNPGADHGQPARALRGSAAMIPPVSGRYHKMNPILAHPPASREDVVA
jgi:hypothetical protein